MDGKDFRRRLQLNEQKYDEMLRLLDDARESGRAHRSDERTTPRIEFKVADIGLKIEHVHGGAARFLVFGRNISTRGVSVLHGGYIHVGTACEVVLEKLNGTRLEAAGEVRYCRLVAGACHEIGVRFFSEIDPTQLVGVGALPSEAADQPAKKAVVRRQLKGRLLLADAFLPDLVLLKYQLGLYGPEIVLATTPGAVLDTVKRETIDIVVFGLSVASDEGVRTIRLLRETGFAGAIIVLSAETDSAALLRAQAAGATEIVSKPFNFEMLVALLEVFLGGGETPSPLYSTAGDQPGMPQLISRYVDISRRLAEDVKTAYNNASWEELEEICGQLKGSGCGFGFQNVTTTAIAALRELRNDRTSRGARIAVARLIECCRSLAPSEAAESAA